MISSPASATSLSPDCDAGSENAGSRYAASASNAPPRPALPGRASTQRTLSHLQCCRDTWNRARRSSTTTCAITEPSDGSAVVEEAVTDETIAQVVSRWTGIPVDKMLQGERDKLLHMEENLGKRVVGQAEAVTAVANAVRPSSRPSMSAP